MRISVTTLAVVAMLLVSSSAQAELTATYVSFDGSGSGAVEGDLNAVGPVTLLDADEGDMWNGGDNFQYLHEATKRTGNWKATVRVVSQTEAIDGRWGKAGIRASNNLTGESANAMAQVSAGNGSQADPPAVGDHSPVPVRLAGRTTNDGQNGYEDPVLDSGAVEVPNNVFASSGANVSWLSLEYDTVDGFRSGIAADVDGTLPGAGWDYSGWKNDVEGDGDGWYVGLAYSAHSDLDFTQVTRADGLHGVTFDNLSIVPEPASMTMLGLGLMGLMGLRRRRR